MSSRSCVEQARRLPLYRCNDEGSLALLSAHASQPVGQVKSWEAGWGVQQVLPKAKVSMSAYTTVRRAQGCKPG